MIFEINRKILENPKSGSPPEIRAELETIKKAQKIHGNFFKKEEKDNGKN